MQKFDYEILIGRPAQNPTGVQWQLGSDGQNLGSGLVDILKSLGQHGWEVVAVGNLGFSQQNEILLKRPL